MKILKMKLFQQNACYKKPFAYKVAETYPLPPYSTIIGMIHKILQAKSGEYFPMDISVQGEFESIFSNYQNLRMYKKNKVTAMPRNVHQLLNVSLIIHVQAEDQIIDQIYENIIQGKETFTIGRNEDLVRLDEIKILTDIKEVESQYLKYSAYIPMEKCEEEEIEGINYRLNSVYHIENGLRKWDKQEVKYVEKDQKVHNIWQDEEGDAIFFCDNNKIKEK